MPPRSDPAALPPPVFGSEAAGEGTSSGGSSGCFSGDGGSVFCVWKKAPVAFPDCSASRNSRYCARDILGSSLAAPFLTCPFAIRQTPARTLIVSVMGGCSLCRRVKPSVNWAPFFFFCGGDRERCFGDFCSVDGLSPPPFLLVFFVITSPLEVISETTFGNLFPSADSTHISLPPVSNVQLCWAICSSSLSDRFFCSSPCFLSDSAFNIASVLAFSSLSFTLRYLFSSSSSTALSGSRVLRSLSPFIRSFAPSDIDLSLPLPFLVRPPGLLFSTVVVVGEPVALSCSAFLLSCSSTGITGRSIRPQ
mmetsp:Transcript_18804/g.47018  ORF Transcript_18804/g.47018 Transcript_18804/m.47018 type:complete len:307 (-) Transcript_18804:861-1781(-)